MVKLKFRHSHKRIYLLLSTTQNMYVTRMEEADMGDSPVIYLLVSIMSITPGTSVFQPISPLSYQNWTKQQLWATGPACVFPIHINIHIFKCDPSLDVPAFLEAAMGTIWNKRNMAILKSWDEPFFGQRASRELRRPLRDPKMILHNKIS